MTTWISFGAILYPGDKAPAPVSIASCQNVLCSNGTALFIKNFAEIDPINFNCSINGKAIKMETFMQNGTLPYKYKSFE